MITHINTTATTTKEAATTKEKSRVISDVSHVYSHVISGDMNLDILPLEQARDATVSFRQRSIFSGPSELPILYRDTLVPKGSKCERIFQKYPFPSYRFKL